MNQIQSDAKKIAADVATIGGTLSAVLVAVQQVAPAVHLPAGASALIISATAVLGTVIAEASRIAGAKK